MADNTSSYKYTASSAASTRALLDSQTLTASLPQRADARTPVPLSSDMAFRPSVFQRRSSNYADAAARDQSATASQLSRSSCSTGENAPAHGPGSIGMGWKPQLGRTQSWNQEDMKRTMQMSGMAPSNSAGYSTTESGK